ncbi:LCP family protein [Streptomyces sp. NPDC090025]|uniref:LCP family protein n=1 Tax=Streptomyces sp. NPDC090025 TaxID=3365922 RepID=UPI003837C496
MSSVALLTLAPGAVAAAPALMGSAPALMGSAAALLPSALPSPAKGLTILLVGVDSRAGITKHEKKAYRLGGQACGCTDVMMLVHVSAKNDRVSVVSMPRDSLAEFPDSHRDALTGEEHEAHPAKLNSAWAEGGPTFAMKTIERMTKVKIDRYLEVDFRHFMDSVNQVKKGVPVCTKEPLKDPYTGFELAPGTKRVNGGRALQYVRSRHDGKMDFGRIQKQQKFMSNVHQELRGGGVFKNPAKLKAFVSALRGTTAADRALSVTDLITLAGRLRNLTPAQTQLATVPIAGFNPNIAGVGSTVGWDEEQAAEVFGAMRADRPLPKARPKPTSHIPQGLGDYKPMKGSALLCG